MKDWTSAEHKEALIAAHAPLICGLRRVPLARTLASGNHHHAPNEKGVCGGVS